MPVSTVVEGLTDYGFTPTFRISGGVVGPITTIVQRTVTTNERDHAQLLTVEFDRTDSNADDFFTAWDSFTSDDDYMVMQPFVDGLTADTGLVIAYAFKNFQCTVVQEEDFKNNSSTDWHSYIGCIDNVRVPN